MFNVCTVNSSNIIRFEFCFLLWVGPKCFQFCLLSAFLFLLHRTLRIFDFPYVIMLTKLSRTRVSKAEQSIELYESKQFEPANNRHLIYFEEFSNILSQSFCRENMKIVEKPNTSWLWIYCWCRISIVWKTPTLAIPAFTQVSSTHSEISSIIHSTI